MTDQPAPSAKPATSRLAMFAAGLAGPLAFLATIVLGVLLLAFGVVKLLPAGTVDGSASTNPSASADLVTLASGGVITSTGGIILVGILQIALGLGLLVPASRAMAGLGCTLAAAAVAVGFVFHWSALSTSRGLNETGVSLLILFALLLAGAALGTRSAAKRIGASA